MFLGFITVDSFTFFFINRCAAVVEQSMAIHQVTKATFCKITKKKERKDETWPAELQRSATALASTNAMVVPPAALLGKKKSDYFIENRQLKEEIKLVLFQ